MKDIKFSSVNNPIRQIIPIKKSIGLFQISYTDWYYADYWGNLNNNDWCKLVKIFLEEVFCRKNIDMPIWYKRFYYKNAVHCWKPGVNETYLYKKIMKIRENVFIAGESYSKIQGWCEGSLISSIDLVKML